MAEKENEEKKVVEVDRTTLQEILAKLDNLEKTNEKLAKDNVKLLAVADKGRLLNYESQYEGGELIRTCNITVWEGYRVLGWRTVKNEVRFENGILRENQVVRVFLYNHDDPKKEKHTDINLLEFNQNQTKEKGEIIKESKDTKGRVTLTIRLADGMEFDMDIAFIN